MRTSLLPNLGNLSTECRTRLSQVCESPLASLWSPSLVLAVNARRPSQRPVYRIADYDEVFSSGIWMLPLAITFGVNIIRSLDRLVSVRSVRYGWLLVCT